MAFNVLCESAEKIDFVSLRQTVGAYSKLEITPMPGLGIKDGDAFGISVPAKHCGEGAFIEMNAFLKTLFSLDWKLDIYNLYSNELIKEESVYSLREYLV